MNYYGVWISPYKTMVRNGSTKESKEMEIPGSWLHDKNRMVFSTTSKGLAKAQAECYIGNAEARGFDE